jgi:nucleotide-binding universal stress UspA family protein/predicted transcriptional regulator
MDGATLLVPLDGSPLAEAGLPYAEAIAEATGASLHLLSVVEREPRLPIGHTDLRAADVERHAAEVEAARQQARAQYLVGTAAALRARGLVVTSTILPGDPVAAILAAASEPDVAMIVMASRGRGAVGRWLTGSVADAVMRTGRRPTLLVRPPYVQVPPRRVRLQQLLVALDGSPLAETALPLAGELAVAAGATLYLVRVEPSLAASGEPPGALRGLAQLEENATAAARAYLARARDQLPTSLSVETIVLEGSPATILAEFVFHERIDLVVMSSRGWSGLRRLLLGSTAEALVQSNVPTLIVRPPAAADAAADAPLRPPAVTVGEIMSQPAVTAREDATLEEIARLMLERGIGCVPLVDAQGKLSGIITETDLTGKERYDRLAGHVPYLFDQWVTQDELEAAYEAGRMLTAREIMSAPVVTATENELVVDVVQRMLRQRRWRLPVLSDRGLVGVLTRHDLLKMLVREPSAR